MMSFKSVKVQLNLFLAAFGVFLYLQEPGIPFLTGLLWGLGFSVLLETALLYLKTKKIQITASAITTGFIIGYVFSSSSPWWMFLCSALFAVGLKRLIRFHGKNILNPAALGIFLVVLLLKGYTEWKGAYAWYILIAAGFYIVHKIRKTEVVLGYFGMSLLLFIPQALSRGTPLAEVPGFFNYFFIFIMLIEPKTSPAKRWPKVIFGAGAAALVFALTEWSFPYEPELFALLVFNVLALWLDKLPDFKPKALKPTSVKGPFMKSKRTILFLCACLLVTATAAAHPPSKIKVQFDPETKTLTAVITHRVSNPATHFINKVDIGINGKEVQALSFDAQETSRQQTISIPLPQAKKGDTLSVEAYCNLSGKLEKSVKAA